MRDYMENNMNIQKDIHTAETLYNLKNMVQDFLNSKRRKAMITGEQYYIGNHSILKRTRTVIGKEGEKEEILNLPNNKIVDNQYARMVDQKNGYLLAKPATIYCENKNLIKKIDNIFNKAFFKLIKTVGEDCINCGIGYLYIYINEYGKLCFKKFRPYNVIPFWSDDEHIHLDKLVRFYDIKKDNKAICTQVELYTKEGIYYYIIENGQIVIDKYKNPRRYVYSGEEMPLSWGDIPIIPFKFNSKEIPLINKVKTLQDALNTIRSDFMNNMQEDARNTILILKNYDGTDIAEFRKNLSEYGVVKVRTIDGQEGGVETLKINIDSKNYDILANTIKKAIIENARGYEQKDEKTLQNTNQMGIKNMYADIDLDANLMESEFQEAFEKIFDFIKKYIKHFKGEKYEDEKIDITFNKDMLINEAEAINNCVKSKGIISEDTILSKHPFINNIEKEKKRMKNQKIFKK